MELSDMFKFLKKKKKSNLMCFQYHGRANSMPKRLREYFDHIGKKFDDDDFIDVVEWVEIEIVNVWKKGN
jgi:hypothetical protein